MRTNERGVARRRAAMLTVALALVIGAPDTGTAGYDFSISASSTDASMNRDPSTDGPRSLYLWLVCGDTGIAAFEGRILGDLMLMGPFLPAPGVLNIGSGSEFQLAIAGCPVDTTVQLGHWTVWDTGGTMCLGSSLGSGTLAAVDCEALPNTTVSPRVVGFSSAAQAPCSHGGNPCLGRMPGGSETVIGYGTILEPPYVYTGVGEDVLYLNGHELFPTNRAAEVVDTMNPDPGAHHALLMEQFSEWILDGGVVAFGRTYVMTAGPQWSEPTRNAVERIQRGEVVSEEELSRTTLTGALLEDVRKRAKR